MLAEPRRARISDDERGGDVNVAKVLNARGIATARAASGRQCKSPPCCDVPLSLDKGEDGTSSRL